MTDLHKILTAAQALPTKQQGELIAALWDSLQPEDWVKPSEPWLEEVSKRSKAWDQGQMELSSWEEVRKRVRKDVGLEG